MGAEANPKKAKQQLGGGGRLKRRHTHLRPHHNLVDVGRGATNINLAVKWEFPTKPRQAKCKMLLNNNHDKSPRRVCSRCCSSRANTAPSAVPVKHPLSAMAETGGKLAGREHPFPRDTTSEILLWKMVLRIKKQVIHSQHGSLFECAVWVAVWKGASVHPSCQCLVAKQLGLHVQSGSRNSSAGFVFAAYSGAGKNGGCQMRIPHAPLNWPKENS